MRGCRLKNSSCTMGNYKVRILFSAVSLYLMLAQSFLAAQADASGKIYPINISMGEFLQQGVDSGTSYD